MARSNRVLALIAAVVATVCFIEGACVAATRQVELPGRKLTQISKLWGSPAGKPPKLPTLYEYTNYGGGSAGKKLTLKVGVTRLPKAWVTMASSLWLPDGYSATLYWGPTENDQVHVAMTKAEFTQYYLGVDLKGKIIRIRIHKQLKYAEYTLQLINDQRTMNGIGSIVMNKILSARAQKLCQESADAGSFGKLNPHLSKELVDEGVYNKAVAVLREKGVDSANKAVAAMFANPSSESVLWETKWVEMGVGFAMHHLGETSMYACVIMVEH